MSWEVHEKWFFVRLINEHGQLADGTSDESYEIALIQARFDAATVKPPIYQISSPPLSGEDLLKDLGL